MNDENLIDKLEAKAKIKFPSGLAEYLTRRYVNIKITSSFHHEGPVFLIPVSKIKREKYFYARTEGLRIVGYGVIKVEPNISTRHNAYIY